MDAGHFRPPLRFPFLFFFSGLPSSQGKCTWHHPIRQQDAAVAPIAFSFVAKLFPFSPSRQRRPEQWAATTPVWLSAHALVQGGDPNVRRRIQCGET